MRIAIELSAFGFFFLERRDSFVENRSSNESALQ